MSKQYTDAELIELGRRHVIEKDLRAQVDLWKAARAEVEELKSRIVQTLHTMDEEGWEITETDMARDLGVDRLTVRGWRGKSRSKGARASSSSAQESPVDPSLLS